MDPIVINVIVWILIRPKLVLTVDPVEANVWFFSMTVWKFTNVTFSVGSFSIHHLETFILSIEEIFFKHMLENLVIRLEISMT